MKPKDRAKRIQARDARVKELYEAKGRIRATDLVEDARDPDSPLHDFFEWDNAKAAEAFRLTQARRILREIRFEVTFSEQKIDAPVYVQDTRSDDDHGGYVSVADLKGEDDYAREVLVRRLGAVHSEMLGNRRLADELGLADVFDQFINQIESLRCAVSAA